MSLHARTPSSPRLPTTTGGGHSAPTPSPLSSSSATVHQQQQHQHRRTKPSTPGAQTLSSVLKKIALVGFLVVAVWWIYVWKSGVVQDFFDPNDKIQRSRPAFRYVEPYSDKHRYRPAASPVIKETDRWGKVKYRGQYT